MLVKTVMSSIPGSGSDEKSYMLKNSVFKSRKDVGLHQAILTSAPYSAAVNVMPLQMNHKTLSDNNKDEHVGLNSKAYNNYIRFLLMFFLDISKAQEPTLTSNVTHS